MELKGKIVFSSGKTGDYDIWTLDLTSKELKQLTFGDFWNDCPKWSPDGKKIIFVSNRTGTPEIWMMDEDGKNEMRITDTNRWHNTPDWSPDGTNIVFCANYDGNIDIYTKNIDGSNLEKITDYEGMDFTPHFSPDGKTLIFTSQRSGNDDIWTYTFVTKELKQLTTYKEKDYFPIYSPDGSQIAFVCGETSLSGGENLEIYLMDKDGQNRRRITRNSGADRYVAWSPDGKLLIYASSRPGALDEKLMVMDLTQIRESKINFDRSPLEKEIDVEVVGFGLLKVLPKSFLRNAYPSHYFGTERYPDWKF
ncbi:MAG: hypothetical protein FJZ10_01725 [Candidatus Omnitrophica bacterium]|nr:hypothetical protein [Candidatus Omnitrophota bacterium]